MRKAFALSVWESLMTNLQQAASLLPAPERATDAPQDAARDEKVGGDDPDRDRGHLGMSVSHLAAGRKKSWHEPAALPSPAKAARSAARLEAQPSAGRRPRWL